MDDMLDEAVYDRLRLGQWLAGVSRRDLLKLTAAVSAGLTGAAVAGPATAGAAPGPIVKALPPELFTVLGTNAEMRWSAMAGQGDLVPIDRFFVRNHTSTPIIDAANWQLRVFGAGLRHGPVEFSYRQLRRLPSETVTATVECAGTAAATSPPSRARPFPVRRGGWAASRSATSRSSHPGTPSSTGCSARTTPPGASPSTVR